MKRFDLAIIGGGMVGGALALSMAKTAELTIAIIEPNSLNPALGKDFSLRVSAITPSSQAFLERLGVWDLLKRKQAFTQTKVWDQNSHGTLDFAADEAKNLGHIVENDAIQAALFEALKNTKVQNICAKLQGFEKNNSGYKLQFDDGTNAECGLLVGADGANSRVRDLAGIKFSATDYQQQAIICNIRSEKSFENTTWQRFLADGIIALLPLADRQAAVVWSAKNALADELLGLPKTDFANRLAAGVECRFGEFKVLSEIGAFPLIARSSKDYVKPNLALIGDAAHNIHPLAGQGVNLGFADVQELSKQLAASNQNIGDFATLRIYARARRLDNELMAKTMSGLDWIYKENSEPIRWLRGFGMNFINQNPTLKAFFQKQASGG
ncbi:MAG: UbiH/UbiF/VisC/COQ6 family ubiquinone biosynthesis hydroxylase [Candidatus Thioglobus sp.]|nr:UbiH/UbiF/VisC/COQ6 family ubiquinone biosynthesis hydroxylase [Candidatus Thioglobus sp.]